MKKITFGLICMSLFFSGCGQMVAIGEAINCEERCNIDAINGKWLCNEEIVYICNNKYPTKKHIRYLLDNCNITSAVSE